MISSLIPQKVVREKPSKRPDENNFCVQFEKNIDAEIYCIVLKKNLIDSSRFHKKNNLCNIQKSEKITKKCFIFHFSTTISHSKVYVCDRTGDRSK